MNEWMKVDMWRKEGRKEGGLVGWKVLSVNKRNVWVSTRIKFHYNWCPWDLTHHGRYLGRELRPGASRALWYEFHFSVLLGTDTQESKRYSPIVPFSSSLNLPTTTTPVISQPSGFLWIFSLSCRVVCIYIEPSKYSGKRGITNYRIWSHTDRILVLVLSAVTSLL